MANSLPFSLFYYSCCLLFLSFSLLTSSHGHGGDVGSWHQVSIRSLLPSTACSSSNGLDPSKTKVVHRHGPCSPLIHHQKQSHVKILDQDQSRVDSIHRRSSVTTSKTEKTSGSLVASIPAHTGYSLGTGNYIVTVGFGTPQKPRSVIFDTGSDVTWIQCKPCVTCYKQQDPLFDPSQSSTYRNLSCGSKSCSILGKPKCSNTSPCRYAVVYGDNSRTAGSFVQDTLTLTPSNVLPNFLFGCGDHNSDNFGQVAGLIGLGREKASLVSQAAPKYGGVFSYCLPSTSSSTGYLKLGSDRTPQNVEFTQLLTFSSLPSFYFLNLVAISVKGRRLPVSSTVFTNPRTLIDSGTVISRLPPTAYSALRSSFRQLMKRYPPAPALSILDTCYNFTGYRTVRVPTVALQFGNGVRLNVDFSGILYVSSVSQACLAFAPNGNDNSVVIIGNVQQRRFNVIYDVSNQMIGFGAGGC